MSVDADVGAEIGDGEIVVVARMRGVVGRVDELRGELVALLGPTRAEAGCIQYELQESVEERGVFMFYEIWESKAALDVYLGRPNLQAFFAKAGELVDGEVELSIWKRCGGGSSFR